MPISKYMIPSSPTQYPCVLPLMPQLVAYLVSLRMSDTQVDVIRAEILQKSLNTITVDVVVLFRNRAGNTVFVDQFPVRIDTLEKAIEGTLSLVPPPRAYQAEKETARRRAMEEMEAKIRAMEKERLVSNMNVGINEGWDGAISNTPAMVTDWAMPAFQGKYAGREAKPVTAQKAICSDTAPLRKIKI